MPYRATPALVRGINPDSADETDLALTPYIKSSNRIINDNCLGSSYDDDLLEEIETWVAAHLYAVAHLPASQESAQGSGGGISESKAKIAVEPGFRVTVYGQQALRLDYAGNLAALDNTLNEVKKPLPGGPGVRWIGTDPLDCY